MKPQNVALVALALVVVVCFALMPRDKAPEPEPAPKPLTEIEKLSELFTNSVRWDEFMFKTTVEIKGALIARKRVAIIDCTLDDVDITDDCAVAVFDGLDGKFTLAVKTEDASQLIKSGRMSTWAVAALIVEVKRTPWEDESGNSKLRMKGACLAIRPIAPGLAGLLK